MTQQTTEGPAALDEAVVPVFEAAAQAAVLEVTDAGTVGPLVAAVEVEPGVVDVRFASRLPGYVGWRWTVSLSRLPDSEPSVLEVELLPGEGSLVAPPWVPWAERLAEYRRTHPEEAAAAADEDLDAEDLDETDLDDTDLDDTELDDTELVDTELDDTELVDTELVDSELDEAELDHTELDDTDLDDTDLAEAELDGSDLDDAVDDDVDADIDGSGSPARD